MGDQEGDMHGRLWIAAIVGVMLTAGPALANDKADCLKGIKKLQAVKSPTEKQKKQLSDAEQEQIEADWNECKKVLKQ
jgi:hypothetical protein